MATPVLQDYVRSVKYKHLPCNDLYIVKVPGDGSCFFHSLLRAFQVDYITARNSSTRKDMALYVRNSLADALEEIDPTTGIRVYDTLGNGYYKEFPDHSLKDLQDELRTNKFVDHSYIELLSKLLDINIFIVDGCRGDMYPLACHLEMFYTKRNSVFIVYENNHYDVLGVKRLILDTTPLSKKGDVVFDCLFSFDHHFTQAALERLRVLTKNPTFLKDNREFCVA